MLAELRNFSRAAEARHITQPAFGRHIRALENSVGQILIDRSKNPVCLTPAGRQFRTVARNILAQIEDGLKLINGIEKPLHNPIRVVTPHALSSPTLLDLVEYAQDSQIQAPFSVDILRVDFAVEALTQGECDFLLGFEMLPLLQPPFQNLCIGQGNFLLVSRTDASGNKMYPCDGSATPIIRYSPESYSARLIEKYSPQFEALNTYSVFESSMCQIHKEMALRGKGISWVPDIQIREELADGRLTAIEPQVYRIPYQIRLYRNSVPLTKEAQQLWLSLENAIQAGWQLSRPWCCGQ